MKTWVPRYEQIAHLSPDEKVRAYIRGERVLNNTLLGLCGWICLLGVAEGAGIYNLHGWLNHAFTSVPCLIGLYLAIINASALHEIEAGIRREHWHSPYAFSALVEFASIGKGRKDKSSRMWGLNNLTKVLPLLTEDQYALLSPKQKSRFYALITVEATPDFLMAAIETLGCFADVEALPTVRKVAEAAAFTPQQREVRQRAQECVAFLEARVQEKTLEQSLLRGSAANADASHILLRAAAGQETSETERQELLRANVQQ